jgi:predicted Fe-S protein YdhL (DUF1289 family)
MTTGVVVPSPCVGICALDAGTGWCDGCLRTIDEIAAWGALDNRARREVWKCLAARRASRDAAAAARVTDDVGRITRAGNP